MKKSHLIILILLLGCCIPKILADNDNKPNVIMIMMDDLNDYVGFLGGHPQALTPNMDALAQEGVIFANAHSNAPVCAPSRSSMLTGIYPHVSQNYAFDKWYHNDVLANCKSLAAYMGDNGYLIYGTGKLMHHKLNDEWTEYGIKNYFGPVAYNGIEGVGHPSVPEAYRNVGLLDGTFASLADIPSVAANGDAPGYTGWYDTNADKGFRYVSDDDRDLLNDEKSAAWAIDKINELDHASGTQPFMLAVGFVRPHTPLVVPQKYFDKFPLESLQLPIIKDNDASDCFYKTVFDASSSKGIYHYDAMVQSYANHEDGLRKYVQAYLACVNFVDEQVGLVLDALDNSRFSENTIVILTSDHGYNQGEKDYLFKNSLWDESTRVPLIIKDPALAANGGKTVENPVSLVDIYPTILDYCGLTASNLKNSGGAALSGFSMKPFVDDPENGSWDGPDVALTVVKSPSGELSSTGQNYSLRSKEWRYVRYENGKEELYHNQDDPYEWNNLAEDPSHAGMKAEMKQKLVDLVGDVDAYLVRPNRLINPDIEYGNVGGWLQWRNNELVAQSDEVNSGAYAMQIPAANKGVAAFQEVTLEAGINYIASLYSRFSAGQAAKGIFAVKYFDGAEWIEIERVEMTNDDWQQYSIDFTVETGKEAIQYYIYRWATKDFYIDDCFLGKTGDLPTTINKEETSFPQLTVFPNPTSNRINLNGFDSNVKVQIYTVGGAQVKQVVNDGPIDVSDLATGLYLLKANDQLIKFIKR